MTTESATAAPIRPLPQSVDAERSVLGALLVDGAAISRVAGRLEPDHFYRLDHRLIYAAMLDLHAAAAPVDFVTVAERLKQRGDFGEAGGYVALSHLIAIVPTSCHLDYYAQLVIGQAVLRKLIAVGGELVRIGYQGDPRAIDTVLDEVAALVDSLRAVTVS